MCSEWVERRSQDGGAHLHRREVGRIEGSTVDRGHDRGYYVLYQLGTTLVPLGHYYQPRAAAGEAHAQARVVTREP